MTQNTQTTAERVRDMAVSQIAAEIDALTADNAQANQWLVNGVAKIEELERQRDEARAEAERLRPSAEAWEAQENLLEKIEDARLAHFGEDFALKTALWDIAEEDAKAAAARARAAKGEK